MITPTLGFRLTSVRPLAVPSAALMMALLVLAGCGRKQQASGPLPAAEMPAALSQAFATAGGDLPAQVQVVAAAAQEQDPLVVPVLLQLTARPDLTPNQRAAANGCLQGLLEEARRRAAQGNASAEAVLQAYRASK